MFYSFGTREEVDSRQKETATNFCRKFVFAIENLTLQRSNL